MEQWRSKLVTPGYIDSLLKLHLLLIFCDNPRLRASRQRLYDWLGESPWRLAEALEELTNAGLLSASDESPGRLYCLAPQQERDTGLSELVRSYNDPLQRDTIYRMVREAEQERHFQSVLAEGQSTGRLLLHPLY